MTSNGFECWCQVSGQDGQYLNCCAGTWMLALLGYDINVIMFYGFYISECLPSCLNLAQSHGATTQYHFDNLDHGDSENENVNYLT